MKALLASCLLLASTSVPALAQKEIPKAEGHDQCPLGYVNTLGTTCVSPIYYLEQLLVACTGFLIGESRLHIEFHAEHRAPGSEVLEQNHAALRFADHDATAGLRAVRAADQLEAVNVITFSTASHVLNQLGVSSLLPFDLGEDILKNIVIPAFED